MKRAVVGILLLTMGVALAISATACSNLGAKAAKRKVKTATPGLDARGEDAIKRAQRVGDGD